MKFRFSNRLLRKTAQPWDNDIKNPGQPGCSLTAEEFYDLPTLREIWGEYMGIPHMDPNKKKHLGSIFRKLAVTMEELRREYNKREPRGVHEQGEGDFEFYRPDPGTPARKGEELFLKDLHIFDPAKQPVETKVGSDLDVIRGAFLHVEVPANDAIRAAGVLENAGMEDFTLETEDGGLYFFNFKTQDEAQAAEEILRHEFADKIQAGKGGWELWRDDSFAYQGIDKRERSIPISKMNSKRAAAPQERVELYKQKGTADKFYFIELKEENGGWVANSEYGRRGARKPNHFTRTPKPVPYSQARQIYIDWVNEKLNDGYEPKDLPKPRAPEPAPTPVPVKAEPPVEDPAVNCPHLITDEDEHGVFCTECGTRLASPEPPAPAPVETGPGPDAPKKYRSAPVVTKEPSELGLRWQDIEPAEVEAKIRQPKYNYEQRVDRLMKRKNFSREDAEDIIKDVIMTKEAGKEIDDSPIMNSPEYEEARRGLQKALKTPVTRGGESGYMRDNDPSRSIHSAGRIGLVERN